MRIEMFVLQSDSNNGDYWCSETRCTHKVKKNADFNYITQNMGIFSSGIHFVKQQTTDNTSTNDDQ